jgi:hypothetical protein
MKLCEPGDIVFSIIRNRIVARGIVLEEAKISPKPFTNDSWQREGWLVQVEYYFTEQEVRVADHIDDIKDMLPDKYSPFNKVNGRGNQGYLFQINEALGKYFDELVVDVFYNDNDSNIFNITEDESELINAVFEEEGVEQGEIMLVEEMAPIGSNKPKTRRQKTQGRKIDFIKKAEKDKKTGLKAEILVVEYEKKVLIDLGREDLAKKVKWVAEEADDFGYDVLSFDESGDEKYIEVKGTTLMKTTPFDISANEVKTSYEKGDRYWVYRVYYLNDNQPKFYKFHGSIEENFELVPTSFKAYLKE